MTVVPRSTTAGLFDSKWQDDMAVLQHRAKAHEIGLVEHLHEIRFLCLFDAATANRGSEGSAVPYIAEPLQNRSVK